MKIKAIILGIQSLVLCTMLTMQGCITTKSEGNGRWAGARFKGVGRYNANDDKQSDVLTLPDMPIDSSMGSDDLMEEDDVVIINETPMNDRTIPITPVEPVATTDTYIVQPGDTLSEIAIMHNTRTKELIALNNLAHPDQLFVGQKLNVPKGTATKAPAKKKTGPTPKRGSTYVIQSGDSLSKIASRANVSVKDLKTINNLTSDQIIAGEKLTIPAYGSVPKTNSKKATTKREKSGTDKKPVVIAPLPPVGASSAPISASTSSKKKASNLRSVINYLVYPGETLDQIAGRYGVSKRDIMTANNITDPNARIENRRLQIPIPE